MKAGLSIISTICEKNRDTNRAKIFEWEAHAKTLPQLDIPVIHALHGEMYAREIVIPKGTVLTGDIYKFDHFDIMVSGDITVSTDSEEPIRLKGFNFLKGMSGKKRAGFAHEDTHWITIHPYSGETGDEVQKMITAESFDDLAKFNVEVNNADYLNLINELGMTHEEVESQVKNEADMLEDDHEKNQCDNLEINRSPINGLGVFALDALNIGDVICHARIEGKRTKYGRYSNHALFPNSELIFNGEELIFIAKKQIFPGEEVTVNYRDLLKTRFEEGDLLCQE